MQIVYKTHSIFRTHVLHNSIVLPYLSRTNLATLSDFGQNQLLMVCKHCELKHGSDFILFETNCYDKKYADEAIHIYQLI